MKSQPTVALTLISMLRLLVAPILLVLLAAPLRGAPVALAQQPPTLVHLEVQAGYEGRYRPGQWFPVVVVASNDGPDLQATIEWSFPGQSGNAAIYRSAIDLPQGARKRVVLFVTSNEFARIGRVRLLVDTTVYALEQLQLTPVDVSEFMVAVVSSDSTLLNSLSGMNFNDQGLSGTNVVHMTLDQLPDQPLAIGGLNAIFLHDSGMTELTAAQQRALTEWVQLGGQLVIGGGATADRTPTTLGDLLPVRIGALQSEVDLTSLRQLARRPDMPPATTARHVELLPNARSLDSNQLLVERLVGDGRVVFAAFDLAALRAWPGEPALWGQVLTPMQHLAPAVMARAQGNNPLRNALQLPGLRIPPFGMIVLFVVGYIVLIGPVSYLLLKRMRRQDLLWVTIPAIVVVFLVGTYLTGTAVRGNRPLVIQLTVVQGNTQQSTGIATAFVGLFSPNRATYRLGFQGETLVSKSNFEPGASDVEAVVWRNGATEVQNLLVDVSSLRTLIAEQTGAGVPAVESELTGPKGAVRNTSGELFEGAMVVRANSVEMLGDIAPGESRFFNLEAGSLIFPDQVALPSDNGLNRQSIIASLFNSNFAVMVDGMPTTGFPDTVGTYLLFWRSQPVLSIEVDGQAVDQQALTLYMLRLNK